MLIRILGSVQSDRDTGQFAFDVHCTRDPFHRAFQRHGRRIESDWMVVLFMHHYWPTNFHRSRPECFRRRMREPKCYQGLDAGETALHRPMPYDCKYESTGKQRKPPILGINRRMQNRALAKFNEVFRLEQSQPWDRRYAS